MQKWLKCNKILTFPAVSRLSCESLIEIIKTPVGLFFLSRISRTKKITFLFFNVATWAKFILTGVIVELQTASEEKLQDRPCATLFSETRKLLRQWSLSCTPMASMWFCLSLHKCDGKVDKHKHLLEVESSPTILLCNLHCFSWPELHCIANKRRLPTVWRCLRTHGAMTQHLRRWRGCSMTPCRLSFPSPGRFAVCCFHQVHRWPVRSDSWWCWQWRGPSPWLRLCSGAFCWTVTPWTPEDNTNEFIKTDG